MQSPNNNNKKINNKYLNLITSSTVFALNLLEKNYKYSNNNKTWCMDR